MTIMNSQAEPLQCRASGPGAAVPAIIELAGVEKVSVTVLPLILRVKR